MPVQIISNPAGGGELVVMARAEYEALKAAAREALEDAADVAAYDAAKADPEGSRLHPPEVTAALLNGDSLITAYRKRAGMTQAALAHHLTMSQGYISDLEKGRKTGTPAALRAIAQAIGAPPSALGVAET